MRFYFILNKIGYKKIQNRHKLSITKMQLSIGKYKLYQLGIF